MKTRRASLLALVCYLAIAAAVPAAAGTLYENGPINGETDAWTINFGFLISDSFVISTGNSTVTGMSFGVWLTPGDTVESAEVTISSQPLQTGTIYFDGIVNFNQSGCFLNNYSYDVCTETGAFNGGNLGNGTYWVTLQNAVDTGNDPVYWDENSGVGCHSPGCPSTGINDILGDPIPGGTLPSEAFTILGNAATGSVPEPGTLALFVSGALGLAAVLRRKFL